MASLVVAGGFLAAAILVLIAESLGAGVISPWLPLHLALAGGASTAIAGVMPFFVAALAASPPAGVRLRGGAVALVAVGAALVAVRGVIPAMTMLPIIGGLLYLAGIGAVAAAIRASDRAGLMMRRPIVTTGYTLALVNVAIGATLGTLAVAGWIPILERWVQLRPAHAWTNMLGFVSLVIVSTLLHFLPTVLGTRIVSRRTAAIAVLGPAMGSPLVVGGLLLGWGAVAGGGAVLTAIGAAAMGLEAIHVTRDRGHWTSDPGWHRFASLGLLAGVAWFLVGVILAALQVIIHAPAADTWSSQVVGVPLALGWIVGVLLASWTHLLPSIGPGGPVAHARQRVVLGRLSTPRLVAFNVGVALLALGWPLGIPVLVALGSILAGASMAGTLSLAVVALRAGR